MEPNCTAHILDLPSEILEHILSFLTYPEMQKIRPTCKAFNTIGCHILSHGLYRLGVKVDTAIAGFVSGQWYRRRHSSTRARAAYQRRLYRGAGSLMILSGLVRTSQVQTFAESYLD